MRSKIAIIGSGFGMYGLLPAFRRIDGCDVVSICGKNSDRMKQYCKKYNLNQYDNWKKMLHRELPDAIAIAVVPKYQYEIAKYALENGIGVFAEKPLTTSFATSHELYSLAKKKNLPNVIDFIFPEIPEWKEAHKLINSNIIGKISHINVNWKFMSYDLKNNINSWKTNIDEGGGALSFYFSHIFHYLENFLGEIKNIDCMFYFSDRTINNGETGIKMNLLFEDGCEGEINLDISYTGQQKHMLEFIGEEGSIRLENNTANVVDGFELQINKLNKIQKIIPKISIDIKLNKLEDHRIKSILPLATRFIEWCNTGLKTKPDFEEGLRVQELIAIARESINNKLF